MQSRFSHVRCWNVSELNRYLKESLEANPFLANLWVKGEVSNLKQPGSGHLYFTLKDRFSSIKCIMFKSRSSSLLFRLQEGMEIILRASLSVYERDGIYQLVVQEVQPLGIGEMYLAYEQLKNKLLQEGLFSDEWKQALPVLPHKIGIVTSLTGAALKDMLSILFKRFPYLEIIIAPALVQGIEAPQAIVSAIKSLNRHGQAEVIIAGRGGGSLEELWAFNTEEVARAIAASNIPVISAVGHETDYTLADFAADLRAPTPSAAAVLAVPDLTEEIGRLDLLQKRCQKHLDNQIRARSNALTNLLQYSILSKPQNSLNRQYQYLEFTEQKLKNVYKHFLKENQTRLQHLAGKLDTLSPLKVLTRGFAVCENLEKKTITSIKQVGQNARVIVRLVDGELYCLVQEVKPGNE